MSSVCLSMIVRNEQHVLVRSLRSALPLVDRYCIVDTGSTDATKDVIRAELADIPGEIHDAPWTGDFAAARNAAIELGRKTGAEWLLVLDADDELQVADQGTPPLPENKDAIVLLVHDAGNIYPRIHYFRTRKPFRYDKPIHEVLTCDEPFEGVRWPYVRYIRHAGEGARAKDPERFRRDAEMLRCELEKDPTDARSAFYLAQSLRDAKDVVGAIYAYRQRAAMETGDAEERWYARYQVARLSAYLHGLAVAEDRKPEELEVDVQRAIGAFLRAWSERPTRLEPLHALASYLEPLGMTRLAYELTRAHARAPYPDRDFCFVEPDVYQWSMKLRVAELALANDDAGLARELLSEIDPRVLPDDAVIRRYRAALDRVAPAASDATEIAPGNTSSSALSPEVASSFGAWLELVRSERTTAGGPLGLHALLFGIAVACRARTAVVVGKDAGAATLAIASAIRFMYLHPWEEPGAPFESVEGLRRIVAVGALYSPAGREALALRSLVKRVDGIGDVARYLKGPVDLLVDLDADEPFKRPPLSCSLVATLAPALDGESGRLWRRVRVSTVLPTNAIADTIVLPLARE